MTHINWYLLITGIVLGIIAMGWWAAMWADYEDCPRRTLGYNCKGDGCDHSSKALAEARHTVGKNYW